MPSIISDDIGSFPLPEGVGRKRIEETAFKLITNSASGEEKEFFNKAVEGAMELKVASGIMHPNYPQFRDMIKGFFGLIEKFYEEDEPWVVKDEFAKIPEIDPLHAVGKKYYGDTGDALNLRVCVTGPLELYLKNVGTAVEGDLLKNLAKSISKFIKNSIVNEKHLATKTISIDEPSLGLNPNIVVDDNDLADAWNVSIEGCSDLDVQIHLHSSADIDRVYQSNIPIIGIESAEDPKNLDGIDKRDLDDYGKFLRVGVARTNIFGIAADFKETMGVDVWKTKGFEEMLNYMESPKIIGKRLENACGILGDRISYAGPDCGLGAWPGREAASLLLKNTAQAVDKFNEKKNV